MPMLGINGIRHYYRLEGHADFPVLVLLHPIGADHSIWDLVVPALTQQFRVLRYDLRGHGGTDSPAGECDLQQLTDDLLALTSALRLPRFCLGGVSLGAMVALQAAANAPERVSALLLCSTGARIAPPPGGWNQRAKAALDLGMEALAGPMVARMFSETYRQRGVPSLETLRTVFTHTDPAGYAACCAALRDADLSHTLSQVKAPALVVSGILDPLVQASQMQVLAAGLSRGEHLELSCGHYPMVELPEPFAHAVIQFMATISTH